MSRALGKQVNRALVLNLIKGGPISRAEIATRSGLSAATISNLSSELIDEGLVVESGVVESARGRPPAMLSLNSRAGFVVGVKVMPDSLVAVVTDLEAEVVAERSVTHSGTVTAADASVPRVVGQVADLVVDVADGAGVARSELLGVGIGLAGVIDSLGGVCRYSPFFDWRDVNLVAPLAAALENPNVYLENDVNSLTIAEQWFGHGRGVENFVVVTVGRGVGVGFVVNGQFYGGREGGVGELGHVTMVPDGPLCSCGRRGCLETLASDPALIAAAERALAGGEASSIRRSVPLDVDALVEAATRGDALARSVLAESGRWLGTGLAMIVNLLNPELIIVAGEGVDAGQWRLGPMRRALADGLFDSLGVNTELVIESAGDVAWARGAACVVLSEFFKSPLQRGRPVAAAASGAT